MNRFLKIFLPALFASAILYFCFPRNSKFPYEYRQGAHWQYETLYADFDFPLMKSDAQFQEEVLEKSTTVIPYYRYSYEQVEAGEKRLAEMYLGDFDYLRPEFEKAINSIYQIGVFPEEGARLDKNQNLNDALVYIQKGKRVSTFPASEIYTLPMARQQLLFLLERVYSGPELDSLIQASSAYELIAPNLIFDEQATSLMNSSGGEAVSPTFGYVKSGSLIVSKGQIITADIKQKLDSYRAEFDSTFTYSRNEIMFVAANVLLAVILVALLLALIYFTDVKIFLSPNRYLYVLMIFLLLSASSLLAIRFWEEKYLYMMPFTLGALYLVTFFDRKVSFPVYMCSLLPMLFFSHSGIVLYFVFTCGGVATIFGFKKMHHGWRQFLLALVVFAVMFASYSSMRLLDFALGESWRTVIYLFVASFLCVAFTPLVYLFERLFSLVSDSRLAELADTSHPLLRELELKAPGTFQHSLQVANMADYVARSVDANFLLLRAGALYHDIGKINNPRCFVENESLMNIPDELKYHSGLTPLQSARNIIKHVSDGLEMAEKRHIPQVVRDFIQTHHGVSLVTYFYAKFLNEGGSPEEQGKFRYNGVKPRSREQVILMICDSVEAAARTLKYHNDEEYEEFISRIIKEKMDDGQFSKSLISLHDLDMVKNAIKAYLSQIHHQRVVYPKLNNQNIK